MRSVPAATEVPLRFKSLNIFAVTPERGLGYEERYEHLNAGQIRMNIGLRLRKLVPPAEYASSEK